MSGWIEIVLIVAAVAYMLVRRVAGEPAEARRMLVLPGVLTVVGLKDLHGHLSTASVVFLVAMTGISVLIGACRGLSVRLLDRDGIVVIRYTAVTLVLWLVNIAIKFGGNALLKAVAPHDAAPLGNSLLLTLGAGMLVEGLTVLARTLRSGTPIIWSAGKDGGPHTTSSFLDDLQRRVATTARRSFDDPHDPRTPRR